MTEIIPVAPRTDIYLNTQIHTDDQPTVADYTPYATAQAAELQTDGNEFSYGKLWRAYMHDRAFLLEM